MTQMDKMLFNGTSICVISTVNHYLFDCTRSHFVIAFLRRTQVRGTPKALCVKSRRDCMEIIQAFNQLQDL